MNRDIYKYLASIAIGYVFFFLLALFWVVFPQWNPVFQYLLDCCATKPWIPTVIFAHDLLINLAFCLVPAILIIKIRPKNIWLAAVLSVLPMFLEGLIYQLVSPTTSGYGLWLYFKASLVSLLPLPLLLLLLFKLSQRDRLMKD